MGVYKWVVTQAPNSYRLTLRGYIALRLYGVCNEKPEISFPASPVWVSSLV